MSRYDRETIKAKLEWEGDDGVEWFKPEEVPEDLEDLWQDLLHAKRLYDSLLDELNARLWDED
jgi:hypothetical protein